MFATKHARDNGIPTPPGSAPKLVAIHAQGITKRLQTIKPGTTEAGAKSQTGCSKSIDLHRPTPRPEADRSGPQCTPEEDDEFEIKEEVQ